MLTLTDLRSGDVFSGLNRFVDGGDCGDEYNYAPPRSDRLVEQVEVRQVSLIRTPVRQMIEVKLTMNVPRQLSPDRIRRSDELTSLEITTQAVLVNGLPRLDIQTSVDNQALDHRLRVHFPAPFSVERADYDGHFEIVSRPVGIPQYDEAWGEQPRPEAPQRAFCAIYGAQLGFWLPTGVYTKSKWSKSRKVRRSPLLCYAAQAGCPATTFRRARAMPDQ
jgi:mannosylglycerate hydrolase